MSAGKEPLLAGTAADEMASSSCSSSVTCAGVPGTLTVYHDGGISFKPLEVRPGWGASTDPRKAQTHQLLTRAHPVHVLQKRAVRWCSLCGRQNLDPEVHMTCCSGLAGQQCGATAHATAVHTRNQPRWVLFLQPYSAAAASQALTSSFWMPLAALSCCLAAVAALNRYRVGMWSVRHWRAPTASGSGTSHPQNPSHPAAAAANSLAADRTPVSSCRRRCPSRVPVAVKRQRWCRVCGRQQRGTAGSQLPGYWQ